MRNVKMMLLIALATLVGYEAFNWSVNRVYLNPGESAVVRYKGPILFGSRKTAEPGMWAENGEIGIQREMLGPGRHFRCPIWWQVERVPDVEVKPGEVGVVTCKVGRETTDGSFLVDGELGKTEFKGILRKVLSPGRYRMNPYGYTVEVIQTKNIQSGATTKSAGWVSIPTGYVGVVTNLADNPMTGAKMGVQDLVIQPGIYLVNPSEQQIDIFEVGLRETSLKVVTQAKDGKVLRDQSGEPVIASEESGIRFPSADGYPMHLDYTLIWGLMPDQAPHAIRSFGNVAAVESKIVVPQIESVTRNAGSAYKAVQLLVGEEREAYQNESLKELHAVLDGKGITVGKGLVRHVYIPRSVREPIQRAYIADELTLTRAQEQQTTREEANLREAEQKVTLAGATVDAETSKLTAQKKAEGSRKAAGIKAETEQLVAAIEKDTAALEAQAERLLGEAQNLGKKAQEEAKASRFELAVEAFGQGEAYNRFIFAENLPEKIKLDLIWAGQGTLWTGNNGDVGIRAYVPVDQSEDTPSSNTADN